MNIIVLPVPCLKGQVKAVIELSFPVGITNSGNRLSRAIDGIRYRAQQHRGDDATEGFSNQSQKLAGDSRLSRPAAADNEQLEMKAARTGAPLPRAGNGLGDRLR